MAATDTPPTRSNPSLACSLLDEARTRLTAVKTLTLPLCLLCFMFASSTVWIAKQPKPDSVSRVVGNMQPCWAGRKAAQDGEPLTLIESFEEISRAEPYLFPDVVTGVRYMARFAEVGASNIAEPFKEFWSSLQKQVHAMGTFGNGSSHVDAGLSGCFRNFQAVEGKVQGGRTPNRCEHCRSGRNYVLHCPAWNSSLRISHRMERLRCIRCVVFESADVQRIATGGGVHSWRSACIQAGMATAETEEATVDPH
eukprot:gnl/TRDRNA2_/TRDRNA2_175367_c1_seq12.p1 gnl/TRDRNA2_/TRDRNA2_175367_c1~~gnl/TRDRNA2_/TRDRNA2_175367_c1_seq12.p1  ORF type:complete len:253 (+),score=21.13 gnl/TRDRNA2_/TRDRNA2_175367_c1_seq12:170-928(+)